MPVTIKVNGVANSLVHKGSNGVSIATIPDVCKTPSPGGPVPIPYPNISQSATLAKGTTTVKADGGMMIAIKGSEFSLSNGDNAGVAGGVKSSTFMKESTWILYSFDVKMDGKNACRLTDKKFQNHENTVNLGGVFNPPVSLQLSDREQEIGDALCKEFCKKLREGFNRPKKGRVSWRKKDSISETRHWSNELEEKLNKIQSRDPWKKLCVDFPCHSPTYGAGLAIPDAVMVARHTNGRPITGQADRIFDFKFPGDRFRGDQRKIMINMCHGKRPVEISSKTCAC
ncbi:DUF4150 domain-containing protein [Accumulibacter sp.]|uniref:DUF4150 domain-containing protein n=1 Tax=Accumulibacter sp. TaxID=2053492 RepID=UPI0025DAF53D|nr:DUF4150 domain-containing protein [Accumulibacter sp.]MCM8612033.1 DUF4150 domain-containing protein [Accumulibacter sp.]MCM8636015.1 DUF4150 domain-containing protein [Accumulibacter sp.]MCM8639856.1 DUF4150 domain-containing protein [Accumulibacter sp.]